MELTDITPILEALITLAAAVATAFLIPFLMKSLGNEKFTLLSQWVEIGVSAAEQIYSTAHSGEEKKNYVLALLKKIGLSYNEEEVNALIESEVLRLNEERKQN